MTWLLLALHSCSSITAPAPGMPQLMAFLTAFFHSYSALGGLDGQLAFEDEAGKSNFAPREQRKKSPWSELSVLDPTHKGEFGDSSELAPKLLPATQLLIAYELRRASSLLSEACAPEVKDNNFMRQLFDGAQENYNSLPSSLASSIGAIMLLGDPSNGVGTLELATITHVTAHRDWKADFLHRSDKHSEIYVRLFDADEKKRSCKQRPRGNCVLCPCHFVCRVSLFKTTSTHLELSDEDWDRFNGMKEYIRELQKRHQACNEIKEGVTPM